MQWVVERCSRSCQFGRRVTAVVLHVVHGCLVGMKQSMFGVFERLFGLMVGSDVVFGVAVFPCVLMMPRRGVVVVGGNGVVLRHGENFRRRHRRRPGLAGGPPEIVWQGAALVLGVKRARRLAAFQSAQGMTMSGERLMRGMSIVLTYLEVPRGRAMELCRLLVVVSRRRVMC
jgi:hypothetical protein